MASGTGRPRTLDEALRERVCAIIAAGGGVRGAAEYVGCSARTIRREMKANPDFAEQVQNARLSVEVEMLRNIRQASQRSWRAAAWLLEHTEGKRYDSKWDSKERQKQKLEETLEEVAEVVVREVKDRRVLERIVTRLERLGGPRTPLPPRAAVPLPRPARPALPREKE